MLFKDKEKQEYLIWRLMIDQAEQNKGYGKEALRQIIAMAREDRDCHWLSASHVIGNHRMCGILESLGFETERAVRQRSSYEIKGNIKENI